MDAGDDRDPRDRGIGKVEDWALGTAVYHDENRKLIKHLYNERKAIVTFLTHPGIAHDEVAGGVQ